MATTWYFTRVVVLASLLVSFGTAMTQPQHNTRTTPKTTTSLEEGAEEAGETPQEAKALGLTMLGGIFFVMGVFYLTHSRDPDIRLLTWATVNDTISIFCAVMLYSAVTDLAELFTREDGYTNMENRIRLNYVYLLFWYLIFLGAIAWCSGFANGTEWRKRVARKEPFFHEYSASETCDDPSEAVKHVATEMLYTPLVDGVKQSGFPKKPLCADGGAKAESSFSEYTQMKNNLRCCTLFAHTTGFAGIAGWKFRMDSAWFKDSPWQCATLVPLAIIQYYFIIKVTQMGRRLLIWKFVKGGSDLVPSEDAERAEDSEEDELVEVFEDHIVDGENDFFGLFMSTLIVSTIKFGVGGKLDLEEDEEYKFTRGIFEALIMYLFSAVLFFSAWRLLVHKRDLEEDMDKMEQAGSGKALYEYLSNSIWACLPDDFPYKGFITEEGAKTIKRLGDLFVKILTMSFAWSFMYATQWFLGYFLNGEGSVLAISLAMTVSVCSVLHIFVLDKIADAEEKTRKEKPEKQQFGKEDDEVLRTLLESIGILIGFVWESAFDDALEGIVGEDYADEWLKPVLGILTVAVIFPVWRMYIVPMEIEKGYVLGFVPSKVGHKLKEIFNDQSIGEDVQNSARVCLEEAVMVLLAFDNSKGGPRAIRSHLNQYFKYEPPEQVGPQSASAYSSQGYSGDDAAAKWHVAQGVESAQRRKARGM